MESTEILINFLKQYSVSLSYNAIGKRLFNLKLDRFLEARQDSDEQKIPKIIIDAIINYADSKTILRTFKLLRDNRLLDVALTTLPYSLCFPQERWSPENFLIKASEDLEIEPEMLLSMEKRNEEETFWLKLKLVPSLHPSSTFSLNKPMVFYVSKKADDYLFNGCDLRDDDVIVEDSEYEVRRVLIVVQNEIDLFEIEKLVRLRMSKNVQVRLCLIITSATKKDSLQIEFMEWLSTKMEIPLVKFDLRSLDLSSVDHKEIITKLIPDVGTKFNNELLWNYGIPEGDETIAKLHFMPIEILPNKLDRTREQVVNFLNKRNIPFVK